MSHTQQNNTTEDTIPSISTLGLSDTQLLTLRRYEGYWYLVRQHKFIQIVLDKDSPEGLTKLRKRYIQAIKKEKHRDMEHKHIGELTFSYFMNILLVRII